MTIRLSDLGQVYLVCGKTDMRQGIDSLAYLVKSQLNLGPLSGQVYLFCGGRKKTTSYKEQNLKQVQRYLDVLAVLSDLPFIYIDETGIDTYLYRKKGRAIRGKKVYAKISGRRFERISVVAGQSGYPLIAPMIYYQSMTSDFFVEWFKTQLLPSLSERHIIIMDNASFHLKNRLDQLCIEQHHHFLPLPAYSPELNPIE